MSDSIRGWSGNRDNRGRFTRGNSYAALGWRAMVEQRFGGDKLALRAYLSVIGRRGWLALVDKRFGSNTDAAKAWVGRVGAWEYARQAQITRRGVFQYPGEPETFLAEWRRRLEFSLADVGEMKF